MERKRERGRGRGRRKGDVYRFLRYVTLPYLSFPLVDCGYDEDESFEVSTKEREKESCKLQVTSQLPTYIYFTLPGTYIPYLTHSITIATASGKNKNYTPSYT